VHVESEKLFCFNPNKIAKDQWEILGLKDWQVNVINSYLEKAGAFKTNEQFLELDVLSEKDKHRLFDYVDIIDVSNSEESMLLDINKCIAEDLREIDGVGFSISSRILNYRDALGGFVNPSQINQVFGLDSSLSDSISKLIFIDSSMVRRININKCPSSVLLSHPYITWNVANAIVNYRDQHGPYLSVSEIRNTDLVNLDLYRKIAPYFSLVE
jgi:DNA uptake protein ComE-like DNA-binding protein